MTQREDAHKEATALAYEVTKGKNMYRVMVCEDTRESASGDTYELSEYQSCDEAFREAGAARIAYPNGNAWVENEFGEIVKE